MRPGMEEYQNQERTKEQNDSFTMVMKASYKTILIPLKRLKYTLKYPRRQKFQREDLHDFWSPSEVERLLPLMKQRSDFRALSLNYNFWKKICLNKKMGRQRVTLEEFDRIVQENSFLANRTWVGSESRFGVLKGILHGNRVYLIK